MTVKLAASMILKEVVIFNAQGQAVKTVITNGTESSITMDVREFAAGVYTVQAMDSNGHSTRTALLIGQ
jgi:hypothetical protein